jgi:hypothetical protein
LAPAVPGVVVDLAVLVRPEVLAVLARLPLLSPLAVLALVKVVALLEVEALLEVVAELAVEEVAPRTRSFSAAMVGNLPSTETPRYSPVPRSGRKAKHRP